MTVGSLSCFLFPDEQLAIIYANRSAVLVHLLCYRLAILDIKSALKLKYPNNLKCKLFEREAKCYLALNLHSEALNAFKETVSTVAESNLTQERKTKMLMESQIMVSMLSKDKNVRPDKEELERTKTRNDFLPQVTGGRNKLYPSASQLLFIKESKYFGRYGIANQDIKVGDILIVERASCVSLMPEHRLNHCQYCFTK